MYVTLYGKKGNVGTDQVFEELGKVCNRYMLVEQFEWAKDPETNKTQACHIGKDDVARIQKMPTIRLVGDKNDVATWLLKGKFKQQNTVTTWHYLGQEDEFWIVGLDDCLDFVQGAAWRDV